MPGGFIGIAEECGLAQPLGEWTLHEACVQSRRLAGGGHRAGAGGGEPLGARVPRAVVRDHPALDPRRDPPRPDPPRAGDHRERGDAAVGRDLRHAGGAVGDGDPALRRRLRHRVFEPRLPQAVPDRQAEDRPLVRARHPDERGRHRDHAGDRLARAQPRAARGRRRRRDRRAARLPERARLRRRAGEFLLSAARRARDRAHLRLRPGGRCARRRRPANRARSRRRSPAWSTGSRAGPPAYALSRPSRPTPSRPGPTSRSRT